MIPTRKPATLAFSLVEVAFALALAAFCLIVLTGFLSQGLASMQSSTQESIMADLATQIAADLRATGTTTTNSPFYNIPIPKVGGPNSMSSPTNMYVMADGSAGSAITQANANYCVSIGITPPATGASATAVCIRITWPPQAKNTPNQWATNYSGSYEMMLGLNRN